MNLRKLALGLVVSAVSCVGLAQSAPVEAAPTRLALTDCSQTAYLGDRICLDPTTAYGPLVQIFTPGGTYWNAFPVAIYNWAVGESAATQANWYNYGANGIVTGAAAPSGVAFVGSYTGPNPIAFTSNTTYIGWLQWFTYDPSYPSMEFAIVT